MSVILDCELMKYPYSGLYIYCKSLDEYINTLLREKGREPMQIYLPKEKYLKLKHEPHHIRKRAWHKYWKPFLNNCKVWHAPFQSGKIIPSKERYPHIKVVLTIHDLNSLHEGKSLDEQHRSLLHTQSLIDRADTLVCISNFVKEDVMSNCDVRGKTLKVIHNGLLLKGEPHLHPSSYQPKRPFMFGIGYINRKKNYKVLLPLLLSNPEMEMIIAGRLDEPDYVKSIRDEATALGVSERLTITGPVSEEEKGWYLANCTAFVHPSLAEGFGVTVIEAMHFGKPVFLSRRTSLPEIGGAEAFYWDQFTPDYIQHTFAEGMNTYRTTDLPARLQQRAAGFSWRHSAAQYLAAYDELMEG